MLSFAANHLLNSDARCLMSSVWMPDARCQMSDARCLMPDARCQMSDARCLMPDV